MLKAAKNNHADAPTPLSQFPEDVYLTDNDAVNHSFRAIE
jgi:hypothetical protein